MLDELRALLGADHELLAEVCGLVIGYYRNEQSAAPCDLMEAEVDGVVVLADRRSRKSFNGRLEALRSYRAILLESEELRGAIAGEGRFEWLSGATA